LSGQSTAGGKMKETGLEHWFFPNAGATNSSGFTGLPGGYGQINGSFGGLTYNGNWWAASENSADQAWKISLSYDAVSIIHNSASKTYRQSVRCLRD